MADPTDAIDRTSEILAAELALDREVIERYGPGEPDARIDRGLDEAAHRYAVLRDELTEQRVQELLRADYDWDATPDALARSVHQTDPDVLRLNAKSHLASDRAAHRRADADPDHRGSDLASRRPQPQEVVGATLLRQQLHGLAELYEIGDLLPDAAAAHTRNQLTLTLRADGARAVVDALRELSWRNGPSTFSGNEGYDLLLAEAAGRVLTDVVGAPSTADRLDDRAAALDELAYLTGRLAPVTRGDAHATATLAKTYERLGHVASRIAGPYARVQSQSALSQARVLRLQAGPAFDLSR